MKVELGSIPPTRIERFNGGEGITEASMYVDAKGNRVLRGRLPPGSSIGLHRHVGSMETIFILSGTGRAVCDGVEEELASGDCHICPEGSEHCLVNDGGQDLTFVAVVPKLGRSRDLVRPPEHGYRASRATPLHENRRGDENRRDAQNDFRGRDCVIWHIPVPVPIG